MTNDLDVAPEVRQRILDHEHLRLLALGNYVAGGLSIAFASLFIFHFVFMLAIAGNPGAFSTPGHPQDVPTQMFRTFAWCIGVFILIGWLFGAVTIYAGKCIQRRRRRVLTMVVAAMNTLWVPVGTAIGVLVLITLARPGVIQLYETAHDNVSGPATTH